MADDIGFEDCVLKVNKTYAAKFKKQNDRAELDRLQQKYGRTSFGNGDEEDSETTSESEDEDAKELNDEKEKDFLKTLAMIKNKDPKIYKKDTKFYSDDIDAEESKSKKPTKPVYLKDYERELLLKKGSEAFVSDNSSEDEGISNKPSTFLTYVEEQEELKNSFKHALSAIDDDKDDFLSKREKSEHEMEIEGKDYSDWLKKKNLSEKDKGDLEPLWKLWSNPNLDDDEKFLRNFILQKGYIDNVSNEVPTYDEVVENFEKEEDELEHQEEFERKFNFRYEEPESSQLKSYPRDVSGSLRRKDNRRIEKRQERNERKLKEKEEKKSELKRLKNLKKQEILEKLEKLKETVWSHLKLFYNKEVTGNPNVGFNDEDLDGDFDPEKYDKAMQNAFNDEYYDQGESKKPEFHDEDWDDYEEENWDEWNGEVGEEEGPDCEDQNFIMDADFEVNSRQAVVNNKRKRSAFSEALHAAKPNFDPNEKTFEEYFDEYYKLDYEDIVGDLPCRFKYRKVEPNDFGLTVDEILRCDDKELNQWSSLKKTIQYRTKDEEKKDIKRYRQKGKDLQKKMNILKSLAKPNEEETEIMDEPLKDNNIKPVSERRLEKIARKMKGDSKWKWRLQGKGRGLAKDRRELNKKRRLMSNFRGAKSDKVSQLSSSRLLAYGVDKKKKKKS